MTLIKTSLAAAALLLAASGAAQAHDPDNVYGARRDSITPEFGNSVAHNIAVQTIDPWPPNVRNSRINIDGERALIGIQRYKANKSIPPVGIGTQTVSPVGAGTSSGN